MEPVTNRQTNLTAVKGIPPAVGMTFWRKCLALSLSRQINIWWLEKFVENLKCRAQVFILYAPETVAARREAEGLSSISLKASPNDPADPEPGEATGSP